jgi:hypothetical protein
MRESSGRLPCVRSSSIVSWIQSRKLLYAAVQRKGRPHPEDRLATGTGVLRSRTEFRISDMWESAFTGPRRKQKCDVCVESLVSGI